MPRRGIDDRWQRTSIEKGKRKHVQVVEDTTKEKHQVASTQCRGVFVAATSPMGKRGAGLGQSGRAKGKSRPGGADASVAQPRGEIESGGARTCNLDVSCWPFMGRASALETLPDRSLKCRSVAGLPCPGPGDASPLAVRIGTVSRRAIAL